MGRKVAIVTGANRGIGFHVARQLLQLFPGDVIVTARDSKKGQQACEKLKAEGLKPVWHELDVAQSASVRMFLDYVKEKYGGIDVLVSNAGVVFPKNTPLTMYRQAELAVMTNFRGSLSLYKHFHHLLRPHARIVFLSSELGTLNSLTSDLRGSFDLHKMSIYELDKMADNYLAAVKANLWSDYGWPDRIIETIGVFQNCLASIIARDLRLDQRTNIVVNAGCPGVTATDQMQSHLDENGCLGDRRAKSPEDAAEEIVYLALLPSGTTTPNGEAVHNKRSINFTV